MSNFSLNQHGFRRLHSVLCVPRAKWLALIRAVPQAVLVLFAMLGIACCARAESPRETPTVKMIAAIEPAVVSVFTQVASDRMTYGAGTIIHSDGYILTNHHVALGKGGGVLLNDGSLRPFRFIGSVPERDIAIIQTVTDKPLPTIQLGRSNDLLNGEPIVAAGNPGGRGIVYSSGIISSKGIAIDVVNALVMVKFPNSSRDLFLQFDAASNRGNSGGPLVNALGEQIGIVSGKIAAEENTNFAIPIDRVRAVLNDGIASEARSNIWTGIKVDTLSDRATIQEIAPESPAAQAGLRPQDVLVEWHGKSIRTGLDFTFALLDNKESEAKSVKFERDGQVESTMLTLAAYPLTATVAEEGKLAGLSYAYYHLQALSKLPDFTKLEPAKVGNCERLSPTELSPDRPEFYGVVYRGYLKIAKPGLYRLILGADDGSRLLIQDRLVIDHDGLHPAYERSSVVRLNAGLHPIKVEYMQASGAAELFLAIEDLETNTRELALKNWFRDP